MSAEPDEYRILGAHSFGFAFQDIRHHRKITQQQLADAADVHRTYLASLEAGTVTKALLQIMRIVKALDLEIVIRRRGQR